ncbi:E3 ubiquitin-protein ligase TRIM11-like [Sminthopsis crassicaudata]|uniref:E3 ubiquitin-protein ligase TRIM11-like n=1 Tax=Sminthopsis crassicaudata TaxID=9301 RepID=UPI003D695CC5
MTSPVCSICRGYFSEPVIIACGHTFCGACVSLIWTVGATTFSCPECRRETQEREIPVVNKHLAELTEMECCETPEHGAHKILPAKEAAHDCRQKLQLVVSHLEKHCEQYDTLLAQKEKTAVDWHLMLNEEYFKAQFFLLEEEFHSLERLNQEEKANQDRINQHMRTLQQELMQELQEVGHQSNLDVRHNAKQLLRSKIVLSQRAKAVIPELKEYIIPGMIELLKIFKGELTLDPTSVDSCVIVSNDLKSVKAEADLEGEMEAHEDFPFHYVFAEKAFSSGRQYWEVDVTQLPQWSLGIYTPNLKRKRDRDMGFCSSCFTVSRRKKITMYRLILDY